MSHYHLGCVLAAGGQPAEAEAEYRTALAIWQKLADDHPKVPDYRNRVAMCHGDHSAVLRRLGSPAAARDDCERAVAIREALVRDVSEDTSYRSGLAGSLLHRSLARRDLGDPAGAVADARRALALWDAQSSRSGAECFDTARAHAVLTCLAGQDGSGVQAGRARSEAATALALLQQAIGLGYRNAGRYRTEDALDLLRARPDFQALMLDLDFPAEPFARPR
jgi:hypothetical protein